jgi:hypothetical protein
LGIDYGIRDLNDEVADATVSQSRYRQKAHEELGLSFTKPVFITNAADPGIHPAVTKHSSSKIRLIPTSWSENPRKGVTYKWLEGNLDWMRLVTTRDGQAADLVSHGVNGWIVDVDDVSRLVRWATHGVDHLDSRNATRAEGRKTAEANSYELQTAIWQALFKGFVEPADATPDRNCQR